MDEKRRRQGGKMLRTGFAIAALMGLLALAWPWRDVPIGWLETLAGHRPLSSVTTWHYQLDNVDLETLAVNPADLFVIDYAKAQGKLPLARADVARLKIRPDGRPRLVVAYMSVGEAEEFRFYWKPEWKTANPSWLGRENCAWPKAHRVHFWEDGWRDLVYRGPDAYLKRIVAAGFDGVYLDRVDIHEVYADKRPQARDEMIGFVADLAHTARALNPKFLVIPQNGESLLSSYSYRHAIDGLGKESLLYGLPGTGLRNSGLEVEKAMRLVRRLVVESKPVLVVEYLQTAEAVAKARTELTALGLVSAFEPRALDGSNPLVPAVAAAQDPGSPEYVANSCPPGTAW